MRWIVSRVLMLRLLRKKKMREKGDSVIAILVHHTSAIARNSRCRLHVASWHIHLHPNRTVHYSTYSYAEFIRPTTILFGTKTSVDFGEIYYVPIILNRKE